MPTSKPTVLPRRRSSESGHKRSVQFGCLPVRCLSSFFLVRLLFRFRSGVTRAAALTDKFLSFFDDSFACVAQPFSLLIQVINRLPAALVQRFPCFFAREQHGHHPADDP